MTHRMQQVNEAVRTFRARPDISALWVTPKPVDCLQYACTEVGEALDADTKSRLTGHLRRVRAGHAVQDELGMAAIMLVSALDVPELEVDQRWEPPHQYGTREDLLHEINFWTASAWRDGSTTQIGWRDAALAALWLISMQLGYELLPCVEANLARIERRVTERAERLAK